MTYVDTEFLSAKEQKAIKHNIQQGFMCFIKLITTFFVMAVLVPISFGLDIVDSLFLVGLLGVAFDYLVRSVEHFRYAFYGPEYCILDLDDEN